MSKSKMADSKFKMADSKSNMAEIPHYNRSQFEIFKSAVPGLVAQIWMGASTSIYCIFDFNVHTFRITIKIIFTESVTTCDATKRSRSDRPFYTY